MYCAEIFLLFSASFRRFQFLHQFQTPTTSTELRCHRRRYSGRSQLRRVREISGDGTNVWGQGRGIRLVDQRLQCAGDQDSHRQPLQEEALQEDQDYQHQRQVLFFPLLSAIPASINLFGICLGILKVEVCRGCDVKVLSRSLCPFFFFSPSRKE